MSATRYVLAAMLLKIQVLRDVTLRYWGGGIPKVLKRYNSFIWSDAV